MQTQDQSPHPHSDTHTHPHTDTHTHTHSHPQTYRSSFSVILLLVLLAPPAAIIHDLILQPKVGAAIALIVFLLIVLAVFGFNYVISDEKLIFKLWSIKSGEIKISSIEKIERSYLALSSNACSLKRIKCTLDKHADFPFLLLSPKNEESFLNQLKAINPNIEINVSNKKGFWRFWDWNV